MLKLIAASAVLIGGFAFATYAQEQHKGQMPQQQTPGHMGGMMQQMSPEMQQQMTRMMENCSRMMESMMQAPAPAPKKKG